MQPENSIDTILHDLTVRVRNNTLETAAKVAALYGASDEAVKHILMLRGEEETRAA
jgi:hypothetical protein